MRTVTVPTITYDTVTFNVLIVDDCDEDVIITAVETLEQQSHKAAGYYRENKRWKVYSNATPVEIATVVGFYLGYRRSENDEDFVTEVT